MRGTRRFVVASAIAVLLIGLGSTAASGRAAHAGVPAGLAEAIQARVSAVTIRLSPRSPYDPGPYDPEQGDPQMGTSVVLSADGTTALVGAPGAAKGKGAVYVFHASAESWTSSATPGATLKAGSGKILVGFGSSVAISADGTTAFVGAPYNGSKVGLSAPGAIFVFHVASEDAWASTSTPAATLSIPGDELLGMALAVSNDGTTLLAGDPFLDSWGGGAEVFHASGEDAWVSSTSSTATLTDSGQDTFIGSAVAISGDGTTALLGDTDANNSAGGALVFHVPSAGAWASSSTANAYLSNENRPFSYAALGWAVALSNDGTTAFLGAPGLNDTGSPTPGVKKTAGAVDVFHVSGADAWASNPTPTATLTKSGGLGNDALGALVAVSADGKNAVVSAPGARKGKGAAYVFGAAGEAAWTSSAAPTATLTNSAGTKTDFWGGAQDGEGLGLGTSADGATVLVGAPGVDWNTGAADVFHVSDASSWLTSSTPTAKLTNSALPRPVCVVPRLVGLGFSGLANYGWAWYALAHSKCLLGRVRKVHAKTKKWRGRIVSQSPAPGKHRPAGTKINLKVGK
ncbi:MAG: PASTA domain-containing protein [Thermoplasmata archaeon]|nr:PASTA domain-containing protein [Thermoplasmata archaeon]